MMKKFSSVLLCVLCALLISFLMLGGYGVATEMDEKVFDEANLLSDDDVDKINEEVYTLSEALGMDIIIATIDDNEGKTTSRYANDFYDDNRFGYGATLDGILLLIDMDEREVYILTNGLAETYFPEPIRESLLDQIYPSLVDSDFSGAVYAFLSGIEVYGQEHVSKSGSDTDSSDSSNVSDTSGTVPVGGSPTQGNIDRTPSEGQSQSSFFSRLPVYLFISILIGGISVAVMAYYNKGRSSVNKGTYLDRESFQISRRIDQHVNTTVTQQRIQRNTSSSSSGFGSSSGSSRGGSGRKF